MVDGTLEDLQWMVHWKIYRNLQTKQMKLTVDKTNEAYKAKNSTAHNSFSSSKYNSKFIHTLLTLTVLNTVHRIILDIGLDSFLFIPISRSNLHVLKTIKICCNFWASSVSLSM